MEQTSGQQLFDDKNDVICNQVMDWVCPITCNSRKTILYSRLYNIYIYNDISLSLYKREAFTSHDHPLLLVMGYTLYPIHGACLAKFLE